MAAQQIASQSKPLTTLQRVRELPQELRLEIFEHALPKGFTRTLLDLLLAAAGDMVLIGDIWETHRKLNAKSPFGTMSYYHYPDSKCQKAHKLKDILLDYQDNQNILVLYRPIRQANNLTFIPLGSDHGQNPIAETDPGLPGIRETANATRARIRFAVKMHYSPSKGPIATEAQKKQLQADIRFLITRIDKEFDVVGRLEHIEDGPEGFEIWSWTI